MHVAGSPTLRISEENESGGVLLRLAGELDLATADILRARLAAVTSRGTTRLVVDVGGLEFVDVTGLNALLDGRRALERSGGRVVIRRPRPMVLRMLSLLKLADAFEIED